jgi:hypothetical protein
MIQFFKNLVSGDSETSSKRFASLITLAVVISLAYIATFRNDDHITPEFMFDALCLLVGGGLGLTAIENVFKTKQQTKIEAPAPVQKKAEVIEEAPVEPSEEG